MAGTLADAMGTAAAMATVGVVVGTVLLTAAVAVVVVVVVVVVVGAAAVVVVVLGRVGGGSGTGARNGNAGKSDTEGAARCGWWAGAG